VGAGLTGTEFEKNDIIGMVSALMILESQDMQRPKTSRGNDQK
jgi:hypothetical protein